jgi:hypothetical protein
MVKPSATKGSALVVAIVALAVTATTIAIASGVIRSRASGIRLMDRDVRTVALADAALAETLARLAANPDTDGLSTRPFGHGTIRASVERRSGVATGVEAVGIAGGWEVVLTAELRWSGGRPEVVRWRRRSRAVTD